MPVETQQDENEGSFICIILVFAVCGLIISRFEKWRNVARRAISVDRPLFHLGYRQSHGIPNRPILLL